ncbi:MAG TPA: hypothetical protein VHH36_03040 [Candidatus Thermoplasmatota archaeon]|nr:hypothetical protein [Candidatus Thermoplasmatota archaeon]
MTPLRIAVLLAAAAMVVPVTFAAALAPGAKVAVDAEPPWEKAMRVLPLAPPGTDTGEPVVAIPMHVPVPNWSHYIGPGAPLYMTMADDPGSLYACTANFLWRDGNDYYIGAAGHCFMPANKKATHGSGADYDRTRTQVSVCLNTCIFGGQTGFFFVGATALGSPAYARQTGPGGDIGNDFGIVKIPPELHSKMRPYMWFWEGPKSVWPGGSINGKPLCLYGNAGGFGEVYLTKARAGVGSSYGGSVWSGVLPSFKGDSGSAVVTCGPDANGVHGQAAVGVLTHLRAGVGPIAGTTVPRAIQMAGEANIQLTLVTQP